MIKSLVAAVALMIGLAGNAVAQEAADRHHQHHRHHVQPRASAYLHSGASAYVPPGPSAERPTSIGRPPAAIPSIMHRQPASTGVVRQTTSGHGLDETMFRRVLARPEQRIAVRPGRDVVHSRVELAGRRYLARVFVDVDRSPAEVVTRTSKIGKYWRKQS
jgi:hypothetical protein